MKIEKPDSKKSVLDRTDEEMDARFREVLENLKKEIFSKGLPLTYQDNRCTTENHFVREYEDGTCMLAILNTENLKYIEIGRL